LKYKWSEDYTFPIDYISDGVYGVYANKNNTREFVLMKTSDNIYKLFRYVIDIAGETAEVELSDCVIECFELEDLLEKSENNS